MVASTQDASSSSGQIATATVKKLNANQFMTGLIAGLARKNISTVSIRGQHFDAAVERVYDEISKLPNGESVALRFRVRRDPVHHDSPVVRQAVSVAVQRGLIGLDNPEYQNMRIKVAPLEADQLLSRLPGGSTLFSAIADRFLEVYDRGEV